MVSVLYDTFMTIHRGYDGTCFQGEKTKGAQGALRIRLVVTVYRWASRFSSSSTRMPTSFLPPKPVPSFLLLKFFVASS